MNFGAGASSSEPGARSVTKRKHLLPSIDLHCLFGPNHFAPNIWHGLHGRTVNGKVVIDNILSAVKQNTIADSFERAAVFWPIWLLGPPARGKAGELFPNNALIANGWPELNQTSENHFLDSGVKRR